MAMRRVDLRCNRICLECVEPACWALIRMNQLRRQITLTGLRTTRTVSMATLMHIMLAVLGAIMIISFSCTHAVQLSKQDPARLCTAAFAQYEALHHRLAVARGRSVLPIGETGLSDRMAGIVTAFYYAVLTNR